MQKRKNKSIGTKTLCELIRKQNENWLTWKYKLSWYKNTNWIDNWHEKKTWIKLNKNKVPDYVIKNWKRLNPEYDIQYYDDNRIRQFLRDYYPNSYLKYFNKLDSYEGAGPIKSDFWRVCILYKFGGVYVDADIEPIESIKTYDSTLKYMKIHER